jgi:hypothetical protein
MRTSFPIPGRRLAAAVAAAAAALTLSACGQVNAGAAAAVGDHRISVSQLQTATLELQPVVEALTNGQGSIAQADVLAWMIIAPFAVEVAAQNGAGTSQDEARQLFQQVADAQKRNAVQLSAEVDATPDPVAIEALRGVLALQNLQTENNAKLSPDRARAAQQVLLDRLRTASIVVNPRYGQFRPDLLTLRLVAAGVLPVLQRQPDWQAPAETPAAATPAPVPSS